MSRLTVWVVAATSIAIVGCDPSAKAKDGEGTLGSPSQLGAEWEMCTASVHCQPDLRCFEGMCRSTSVSALADYYWALGNRLASTDDRKGAFDAFSRAIGAYKTAGAEKPPAALVCDHGRALVKGMEDPDIAEQAAQSLHRCMLDVPESSPLRAAALRALAKLADAGLDETKLAGTTAAIKYMTGAPVQKTPSVDLVKLTATADKDPNKASFTGLVERLESDDALDMFKPCWRQHNEATKQDTLAVTLEFRSRYYEGEFAAQDRYVLSVGSAPPGEGAACVHAAVNTLLDGFDAGRGSWRSDVTLSLAPRDG